MAYIFKAENSEDDPSPLDHLLGILWPMVSAIIICAGYAAFFIWLLVCSENANRVCFFKFDARKLS